MNIYRQGDVLLIEVESVDGGTPVKRDKGRIVLAYGEVTGHAHAIAAPRAALVEWNGERYVSSETAFVVHHEEHAPARLPAGTFKVVIQREYTPAEIRRVVD